MEDLLIRLGTEIPALAAVIFLVIKSQQMLTTSGQAAREERESVQREAAAARDAYRAELATEREQFRDTLAVITSNYLNALEDIRRRLP